MRSLGSHWVDSLALLFTYYTGDNELLYWVSVLTYVTQLFRTKVRYRFGHILGYAIILQIKVAFNLLQPAQLI